VVLAPVFTGSGGWATVSASCGSGPTGWDIENVEMSVGRVLWADTGTPRSGG